MEKSNLSMAEKQKRKATFCELIDAENTGIHKYVDAIKIAPEHRKMLQSIMNEEFQHIRLLKELIEDLGEVPEVEIYHHEEEHPEEIHSEIEKDEEMSSSKPQATVVSFKRSK